MSNAFAGEGTKDMVGKIRVDLIPPEVILELGHVATLGAAKYGERNWEQGIQSHKLYGAAMRHLLAFWQGEDANPDTGLPHLAHAMWNVMALLQLARTRPEFDTRPTQAQPIEHCQLNGSADERNFERFDARKASVAEARAAEGVGIDLSHGIDYKHVATYRDGKIIIPATVLCACIDCDRPAFTETNGTPLCSEHAGLSAAEVMDKLGLGQAWASREDGNGGER